MIRKSKLRKVLTEQTALLQKMQDVYVRICAKEQAHSIEALDLRVEVAKVMGACTILLKILDDDTK